MPNYRWAARRPQSVLPDDALKQLVQERWTEVRPMEIGGSSQDMVTLHALVVFDNPCSSGSRPRPNDS